ncbi:hypothetical protein ACFVKB_49055, partial [Rhodococcus sp. NPDC127530]|uniref:hypothetical protein n=1 Tax=unclassified Rhodococcus (in: high G+C Gram-positive bacteria) TaxID=192944 RepID=UPI00362EFDB5
VCLWRTPDTYHTAGLERGDRHLNFYETRDNLFSFSGSAMPILVRFAHAWKSRGNAPGRGSAGSAFRTLEQDLRDMADDLTQD